MSTTGRISALQRLGLSTTTGAKPSVHQRLSSSTTVTDARELLNKRQNPPVVDARQLLSRPVAPVATSMPKITIRNDAAMKKPVESTANKKIVISLVNDQYKKKIPSPPPAVIKRPQIKMTTTEPISFSSSNLRQKRSRDDDDDDDDNEQIEEKRVEPVAKRISVRKPTKTIEEEKNSSTTILITNLQASVTEDDVLELFGEVGRIDEIQTLSHGCVQVTYAKEENAKQAINKYHNRLLDGQSMYVSLQPAISYSTKSAKKTAAAPTTTATTETSSSSSSKKITIDPQFIRQALFNPSTNESNPVRFQVKL